MSEAEECSTKDYVFPAPEDFAIERVFPIHQLVSDKNDESRQKDEQTGNHEATSTPKVGDAEGIATVSKEHEFQSPELPQIPVPLGEEAQQLVIKVASSEHVPQDSTDIGSIARKITQRSRIVPEKHGGVPGVVNGVTGIANTPSFSRCEDEPIHIPGAIQAYGALVALRYSENGDLLVRICSENTVQVLRRTPEDLFALSSFCDILPFEQKESFMARIDQILGKGHTSISTDLEVFTLSLLLPDGRGLPVWCAIHLSVGTKDLLVCEFEARDDDFFPSAPGTESFPQIPIRTVDNPLVERERRQSTTNISKPILALDAARKRQYKIGFMEMFTAMSRVQEQLGSAKDLQSLLDIAVGLVHQITHFHRVMVYRFDKHKNGAVDAEFVDPRASEDLYRGLHFPASDIPAQARDLYLINKIRTLRDRDQETARLVCRGESDFATPLDLTHSYLRAMSPIHLKYLANMEVRSSLSISLLVDGELWGLIACHGYGNKGIPVSLPTRELCRNIGECASINIERLLMANKLKARLPAQTASQHDPSEFIVASSSDLLRIFDADFGLLSIQGESRAIGRLESYSEALALLTHLQKRKVMSIMASEDIAADFSDLVYPPGIKLIAGLLIIPLSTFGKDLLVFFRKGQLKEVRWAGNPYEKIIRSGTAAFLEPRSSFQRWTEKVMGTSREWRADELETASLLSLLYGKFIEVWRQKGLAAQRGRLTRLLILNSSHEVRTPLNAIVNYLEIALETPVDDSTRDTLLRAHQASKSLIYVIDDLLNLTKVEHGQISALDQTFNLSTAIEAVITSFRQEAERKNLDLIVTSHSGLPEIVRGDAARLRQALSNVLSNAFRHSPNGSIKVSIQALHIEEQKSIISITVQDVGAGMSEQQLDALFQDFEQVVDDEEAPVEAKSPGLGLGLALVARYVRNMNGRIKIRSEVGKGTIFSIELPFNHGSASVMGREAMRALETPLTTPESCISEGPTSPTVDEPSHLRFPPLSVSRGKDIPSSAADPDQNILSSSPIDQKAYPFPSMPSRPNPQNPPLRILIAEDNPVNARVLRQRLERSGHTVQVATDGQSCYDSYRGSSRAVDVILMDLQVGTSLLFLLMGGHS